MAFCRGVIWRSAMFCKIILLILLSICSTPMHLWEKRMVIGGLSVGAAPQTMIYFRRWTWRTQNMCQALVVAAPWGCDSHLMSPWARTHTCSNSARGWGFSLIDVCNCSWVCVGGGCGLALAPHRPELPPDITQEGRPRLVPAHPHRQASRYKNTWP